MKIAHTNLAKSYRTYSQVNFNCSFELERTKILLNSLTTSIMYAKKEFTPILYHHSETSGSNRIPDAQGPCSGNRTCPPHCQIRTPPLKGKRLNHREVQLPRRKTDAVLPKHCGYRSADRIRLIIPQFQETYPSFFLRAAGETAPSYNSN